MSKQPDTFIYGTIYLQSIIQKEYCLESFMALKLKLLNSQWNLLLCIRMQQATETEEWKRVVDHGILFLDYAHSYW